MAHGLMAHSEFPSGDPDRVRSLAAALAKVTQLAGSIAAEKTEVPGMGWCAALIGIEGSESGLWEDPPA